ncbi:outer membrane protein assembly factor BamA [Desulfovibrio psychrotolerans]|uniref:Outer membrane protein assembly factor BamA n=1 Tax=Desulfovibrio psychrotolerans TaxID=415242 RepID=A0A7J0BU69_9BACT|nr:outer membrane protein assembly factor BamA [Desulfovibrio psychrotolerans]GFM37208.1 OMP85 family outer membrane protein [Desulfovibrio psychrotolerans]
MSKLCRPGLAAVLSLLFLLVAGSASAFDIRDTKILVLPFEVNAGEDMAYLEDSLPELIAERLVAKGFAVVPQNQALALLQQQGLSELSIAAVRDIAVLAGANYAIYGSFNQVGEELSIDARVVEAYGLQAAKPVFINKSGLINILPAVDELVATATNDMLSKNTVANVIIKGTKVLDPDVVLMRLRVRKGDPLDGKTVNNEIKRIYELGYFSDVQASLDQTRDGMDLVFTVVEKPRIEKIVVEGSDGVKQDDILAAMSTKVGAVMNEKLLAQDLEKVLELYRKEGFYLAKLTHKVEEHARHSASLIMTVEEGEKLYIKEVTIMGVEQLDAGDVKSELALSSRNILSWYTGTGVLREDYLERDSAAIGAYYLNRGFMDVMVGEPQVDYQEDGIVVTFRVKEGQRYKVGNISFKGDLIEPDDKLLSIVEIDEWKKKETFLNYSVIKDDTNKLTEYYAKHGYAYAEVNFDTQRADGETIDLVYTVSKKNKVYVRNVNIEGNSHTRDNVIRRELALSDGEAFDGDKLQRSNRNLNSLGYFAAAEVEMVPTGNPDEVDLKVKVKEQNTGALLAGVGWNTWGGVGVSGSIRESNLWGKGYAGSLTGSFSKETTRYDLGFLNPRVYDSVYSLGLNTYIADSSYDDYDIKTIGGTVVVGRPITDRTKVFVGYRLDSYEIYNVDENASDTIKDDEGNRFASVASATVVRSTVDDAKRPTSGTFTRVFSEYGGGVLQGDDNFIKVIAETRAYYALNKNNVLMGMVKGGGLFRSESGDDVPLVERFWIGGINSVRGYKRSDFAVRDKNGDKIGGTRMAYTNLEYQWYFNNELGMQLVPFFDAGVNIDDEYGRDAQNGFLSSVGLEWRWKSPMGDLRFAYGLPLNKVDGKQRSPRFEFAMGQTF